MAVLCIGVVGLSTFALFPSVGLVNSLLLGISLFAASILFDYVVSSMVLKRDPIYILRRTVALSLFCWILWLSFIILGVVFGAAFGSWWWIKLCLLGFSAVLTLRAVVFLSTSSAGSMRGIVASLLQPLPCIVPFMFFSGDLTVQFSFSFFPFWLLRPYASLQLSCSFIW